MSKKIIIIIPCFNEAERLTRNYFEILSQINNTIWIFVNDGSTDETSKILLELSEISNVNFLNLDKNVGKSEALAHGMRQALSLYNDIEWIGYLDSDAAFSKLDIESIISKTDSIGSYDSIYSSRVKLAGRKIQRSKLRHYIARFIATLLGLFWHDIPYDTQSGFKLYRIEKISHLLLLEPFRTRWFFDIELFIRYLSFHNLKMAIWEEPVSSWTDIPGTKLNLRQYFLVLKEVFYIITLMIKQRTNIND